MDVKFPDWQSQAMQDDPEETILQVRLKERMKALGVKPAPLSLSIGRSDSFVRDLFRYRSMPNADNLDRLARALRTTTDYLLGKTNVPDADTSRERMVPILGLAGAGPNGSVLFSEGQGNLGEVPAPPGASESAVALEVRGDSMRGTADDGWLIFYEDPTEPREEYMGQPCVCWLEDGHVLVKTPELTRYPGLYNLTSFNASTIREVPVRQMALVMYILPREAARKYIRRNPDQAVVNFSNGHRPEARK